MGYRAREAFVCVGRSNEGRMAFSLMTEDDDAMIESGADFLEVMESAGLQQALASWEDFSSTEGWGLPVVVGAWEEVEPRALDASAQRMELIASTSHSICGQRPASEEGLWEFIVRMAESHPHSISRGEFNAASQEGGLLNEHFAPEYVDELKSSREQLYSTMERVCKRLTDGDLLAAADRLRILQNQP